MTVSWNSSPERATWNWEARVAVITRMSLGTTPDEDNQALLN
jgi:hypothetical protein